MEGLNNNGMMIKSESINELAASLAKFQGEITNPYNSKSVTVKTKTGGTYNYKYAPLDEILKLVRPLLSKNGLSIVQVPYSHNGEVSITTTLFHSSGQWIEYPPISLRTTDISPQAAGSVITYGRRYALSAILGIASDDDDDGNEGNPENNKQGIPSSDKPAGTLTDKQVARLYAIAKSVGVDDGKVKEQVKSRFNKEIPQLTKDEYDTVCAGYEGMKK